LKLCQVGSYDTSAALSRRLCDAQHLFVNLFVDLLAGLHKKLQVDFIGIFHAWLIRLGSK